MNQVALVCKLMPLYRLGVFHDLSKIRNSYNFTCFGDTKKEGGIEIIPWSLANNINSGGINWVKTKNYFYLRLREGTQGLLLQFWIGMTSKDTH